MPLSKKFFMYLFRWYKMTYNLKKKKKKNQTVFNQVGGKGF